LGSGLNIQQVKFLNTDFEYYSYKSWSNPSGLPSGGHINIPDPLGCAMVQNKLMLSYRVLDLCDGKGIFAVGFWAI
jgi:hypothetical protein